MNINFNFRDALKPVVGWVDSAVSSVMRSFGPRGAAKHSAVEVELKTFDAKEMGDDDYFATSGESLEESEKEEDDKSEWVTLNILNEISDIKKEPGWPRKVKELRDKLLVGHENMVLDELKKYEKELTIRFIVKIFSVDVSKIANRFDDFFVLKLKVLFHPDQSETNTGVNDQIAREFTGWFDKVIGVLNDPMGLRDVVLDRKNDHIISLLRTQNTLLTQIIKIMTEMNECMKSVVKKGQAAVVKIEAGIEEVKTDLEETKANLKETRDAISKIEDGIESSIIEFEKEIDSDTFIDDMRREMASFFEEKMRELTPASQQFSSSLSLPRLSVRGQNLFLRRDLRPRAEQTPLLLKDKEEMDKENLRPRGSVN